MGLGKPFRDRSLGQRATAVMPQVGKWRPSRAGGSCQRSQREGVRGSCPQSAHLPTLPPPFQHLCLRGPAPLPKCAQPRPLRGAAPSKEPCPQSFFPRGQSAPWRHMGHFRNEGGKSWHAVSLLLKSWAPFPSIVPVWVAPKTCNFQTMAQPSDCSCSP